MNRSHTGGSVRWQGHVLPERLAPTPHEASQLFLWFAVFDRNRSKRADPMQVMGNWHTRSWD